MEEAEYYCRVCSSLDLAFYSNGSHPLPPHLSLGLLNNIQSRADQCSLCALTLGLCNELRNKEVLLEDKIIILKPWEMGIEVYAERAPEVTQGQPAIFVGELNVFPAQPSSIPTTQGGRRKISQDVLKQLLHTCESSHGTICGGVEDFSNNERAVTTLLIDVRRNCLVTVDSNLRTRYVALSYVWGGVKMLMTTRDRLFDLLQKNSLTKVHKKIPQVVHDAIAVTIMMEERYLWIDCLCIVQDEPQWKHLQLSQMDSIYRHAVVTIVAMSSRNANDGLPGVRPGSRLPTAISRDGLNIMRSAAALESSLEGAVYDTRAWTLQEKVLSRRCLFFSKQIVFFRCGRGVHRETEDSPIVEMTTSTSVRRRNEVNPLSTFNTKRDLPHWFNDYGHFRWLAQDYSRRNLSYPGDVLLAFAGIEAHITGVTGSDFLFGIPEAILDLGLLSYPVGHQVRKRRGPISSIRGSTMVTAPSWSWMGWDGPVRFLTFPLQYQSLIAKLKLEGPDGTRLLRRDCRALKCGNCGQNETQQAAEEDPLPTINAMIRGETFSLLFLANILTFKATIRSRPAHDLQQLETDLVDSEGTVLATLLELVEPMGDSLEEVFHFVMLSRAQRVARASVPTFYVMLVNWKNEKKSPASASSSREKVTKMFAKWRRRDGDEKGEADSEASSEVLVEEMVAERRAIGYIDEANWTRMELRTQTVRLI